MNRLHLIPAALVTLAMLATGCDDTAHTPGETDTPDAAKYITLSATAPVINAGGQADGQTRGTDTPVAVTDPVPADTYTTFTLAYTSAPAPNGDGTVKNATSEGSAVTWSADNKSVTLDFTPLQWRNILRNGTTTATLIGTSSTPDTRTSTIPVAATISGSFVVEADAFAPKAAISLTHTGARFAIVLKHAGGTALTADNYTASMYDAADATLITSFSFKPGVDTKVEGATVTELKTPYALINLTPFTIANDKKTLTIINSKDAKEFIQITLTDLDVSTTTGTDGNPVTTTAKLTEFVAGQYLTLTVTLSNSLELAGTPTVSVTPWITGEEWTLNGNK